MKTFAKFLAMYVLATLFFSVAVSAQNESKKVLTVLNIDCEGVNLTPEQMGDLVRLEVEKLNLFAVTDKYDNEYLIDKHELKVDGCYGKLCLVDIGKAIQSDKMLSGNVNLYGDAIIFTLRLIDVKRETIEKTHVVEFLNLPKEIQAMTRVVVKEMFSVPVDEVVYKRLTRKFHYESQEINPDQYKVNLSGPRTGFIVYTGEAGSVMKKDKKDGGYDVYPVMFQFGYQFEVQYLNAGYMQALFEIIPNITGLDQSMVIPSLTVMNGLRNNKNGIEFAFGPTMYLYQRAKGYYSETGAWVLAENDTRQQGERGYVYRIDSRGNYRVGTSFIFALGRSFKSGRLNIPVNVFFIPHKTGWRFGASMGYNAKLRKEP